MRYSAHGVGGIMKATAETEHCRLFLGDCADVIPHLSGFDAIVTDPPFGIYACGGKWGHKSDLQWDREPATGIVEMVSGKPSIIWGGNYFPLPPSRGWLVWFKRDAVPSAASVELAWTSFDMNSRLIDQTIAATNAERLGHPTQKPLRVMLWSLSFLPDGCDTILDPFMGSGTTLIAAIRTGRKAIGIERDEKYFDIALKRIQGCEGKGSLFETAKPEQAEMF